MVNSINEFLDREAQIYRTNNNTEEEEKIVLGTILFDNVFYKEVFNLIKPEYMYNKLHANIYAAMDKLYDNNEIIDPISVNNSMLLLGTQSNEFNTLNYLYTLLDIQSDYEGNMLSCAQRIRDNYLLYLSFSRLKHIVDILYNPSKSIRDNVNKLRTSFDLVGKLLVDNNDDKSYTTRESLSNKIANTLYKREKLLQKPILSGLANLDSFTKGFKSGQLILLAARPSVGKTTLALQIAKDASYQREQTVVFISLEMSQEELIKKLFLSETGLDIDNTDDDTLTEVQTFLRKVPTDKLYLSDKATSIVDVKHILTTIKSDFNINPDLIIIDYLQLLYSDQSKLNFINRQEEISNISRGLKILARQLSVPIIALSQLNRASMSRIDKMPQLHDLRDSGSLEQDADIVCMLHPELQEEEISTPLFNVTKCSIVKNRNGATGIVNLYFYKDKACFTETILQEVKI